MSTANFITAADAFPGWQEDVLTRSGPVLYRIGDGALSGIEVGPERVTLIGGPPAGGKTAFAMQAVVDALRLTPQLKALVANVETSPGVLLDRQLSRLSGIDLGAIRHRQFTEEHADRLDESMLRLQSVSQRLAFLRAPFDLENVAASVDDFEANLILLDYIQRIPPPGSYGDRRGAIDATMGYLRRFADAGMAVMVIAAVSRQKDNRGRSTYSGETLNLASFRESSELEFGADDAYMLVPVMDGVVTLKHLKARHSEPRDLTLRFEGRLQRFTAIATPGLSPVRRPAGVVQNHPEGGAADTTTEVSHA